MKEKQVAIYDVEQINYALNILDSMTVQGVENMQAITTVYNILHDSAQVSIMKEETVEESQTPYEAEIEPREYETAAKEDEVTENVYSATEE